MKIRTNFVTNSSSSSFIICHNNTFTKNQENLLEEFEQQANVGRENKLDKYDVFSSWLDFVFEEYLQEKSNE